MKKITIGGSYGTKNWNNIQNLITLLKKEDYKIIAPNQEWSPIEDSNKNIKFNGQLNIPIEELELNFVKKMLESDIFIICNPNSYVGYMAFSEFMLAYYAILGKEYDEIMEKYQFKDNPNSNDFRFYNDNYEEFINAYYYRKYKEYFDSIGKTINLKHIIFTDVPIGLNYFDENMNLVANFKKRFFNSNEFELDRKHFEEVMTNEFSQYQDKWLNFDWYIMDMKKRIKLIKDGIDKGFIDIGIDSLLEEKRKKK